MLSDRGDSKTRVCFCVCVRVCVRVCLYVPACPCPCPCPARVPAPVPVLPVSLPLCLSCPCPCPCPCPALVLFFTAQQSMHMYPDHLHGADALPGLPGKHGPSTTQIPASDHFHPAFQIDAFCNNDSTDVIYGSDHFRGQKSFWSRHSAVPIMEEHERVAFITSVASLVFEVLVLR